MAVDPWAVLPPYLKRFREMRELYAAETPELQALADACGGVLDELFIASAGEKGLARFERIMGMRGKGDLEARRAAVLARWFNAPVYTLRALRDMLAMLQGNDGVRAWLVPDEAYVLAVETRIETAQGASELDRLLRAVVPANMGIRAQNRIEGEASACVYVAMAASVTATLFTTNDLDGLRGGMTLYQAAGACVAWSYEEG